MSYSSIPGVVGEIADYLCEAAYKTNLPFAEAAAIAAMSSFVASRYLVSHPANEPSLDNQIEPQVVTQSVKLVGESGSGKDETLEAVEALYVAVKDRALATGFSAPETLWRFAEKTGSPLWLMKHKDDLIRRDPYYTKYFNDSRLRPTESDVLVALQRSACLDVATRPIPTRSERNKHYIPSSPVTILAVSNLFREKLPIEWDASLFFGRLLMAYDQDNSPIRGAKVGCPPSPELVKKLRAFTGRRGSKERILVEWDQLAFDAMRYMTISSLASEQEFAVKYQRDDLPSHLVIRDRALNVAALIAIGVCPERPIISVEMLVPAWETAYASWHVMRRGLESAPLPGELGH